MTNGRYALKTFYPLRRPEKHTSQRQMHTKCNISVNNFILHEVYILGIVFKNSICYIILKWRKAHKSAQLALADNRLQST